MKYRIDNMLLGLLWLLVVTLGGCFWFNTMFGFNLFVGAHWQYLSYLQAAQTPVKPSFYISLVIFAAVMIFGLYLIMRPRLRKIYLPIMRITGRKKTEPATDTAPVAQPEPGPATVVMPNTPVRPPRLSASSLGGMQPINNGTVTPPAAPTPPAKPVGPTDAEIAQTSEIFKSAGYTVKKTPRINGHQFSLLAIGTNETLWLGGHGIAVADMARAIEKLSDVFSDTLEDVYINITGFVIGAPDAATAEFDNILMFNDLDGLREYISAHPNAPLPDDDNGNFDAYSEYIDTVINYIGKI